MQAKMLLPTSTIQSIIEEFQDLHSCAMHDVLAILSDKLSSFNIPQAEVDKINQELFS